FSGMCILARGSIAVQACYARVWKMLVDLFLHPLCAHTKSLYPYAAASRADRWGWTAIITMVATKAVPRGVEGQGDGAVGAARDVAAIATEHELRVSAPVQKEDGLLLTVQPL